MKLFNLVPRQYCSCQQTVQMKFVNNNDDKEEEEKEEKSSFHLFFILSLKGIFISEPPQSKAPNYRR